MPPEPSPTPARRQPGRSIASNGYVLIRVGGEHHLADVRGYAYEHRLVAERKIGRRLAPGEIVHHINEVKTDNRPENLEVVASLAEHFVYHRTKDAGLKMPGEPNLTVSCECGCGASFLQYDGSGRPRRYVSGHNPQPAPSKEAVLGLLGSEPGRSFSVSEVTRRLGLKPSVAKLTLSRLSCDRRITRTGHGLYAHKGA